MNYQALVKSINEKKSLLCVGMDTDINKLPKHLLDLEDPIFEFNKAIIDATLAYTVAYKPNLAFYEAMGINGLIALQKTVDYIGDKAFTIADAKRGDIGNTSKMYAEAFFNQFGFDSITVAPYMGEDSIKPFLEFKDKMTIVLGLTSNIGAKDFQLKSAGKGQLFEEVISTVSSWAKPEQLMFVVGATRPEQIQGIRKLIPNHFLLVPGVGAQGGSLDEVCKHGFVEGTGGLLINSSRGIQYASAGIDFKEKAAEVAHQMQQEMAMYF